MVSDDTVVRRKTLNTSVQINQPAFNRPTSNLNQKVPEKRVFTGAKNPKR